MSEPTVSPTVVQELIDWPYGEGRAPIMVCNLVEGIIMELYTDD